MFKILALNIMTVLFLASCSHSGHHAHHEHGKEAKPCKVGEKCDESKKDGDCCADKKEMKENCCKG